MKATSRPFSVRARRKAVLWLATAIAGTAVVVACGGGSDDESGARPMGNVRFALTDAPACGFDAVNVTVTRVRIHASDSASESAGGWHDLPVNPARRINLLDLNNGVLEELGQMPVPAGQYTQIRLVLQANTGGANANSIVPTGSSEQPLDTPSAAQSGLKLIHPFTVPAGGLADLVLDFDACKSIVTRGNGTFGLKPVIAVLPRLVAEIVGNVDPTLTGVRVSAQAGGNVLRSTTPDATGAFRLTYLNPAVATSANVVITATGRTTAVVSGVPIAVSASTRISTVATPILLSASATRSASGTVAPASAEASVAAFQVVGALPGIEVASVNADATGAYTLTLPTAAPLLAPFAPPLPLVFLPQTASAARYTLRASATGFVALSSAIDVGAANAVVNFTLPVAP